MEHTSEPDQFPQAMRALWEHHPARHWALRPVIKTTLSPHFHTAYWITLPDRPDKQWFFAQNLPALGCHPVQRWDGFSPWNFGVTNAPHPGRRCDSDGFIGSYLSHWQLFRHIGLLRQDALVLEDDVLLEPTFLEKLNELMPGVRKDWEFLHLRGPDPERPYAGGTYAYLIRWRATCKLFECMAERHNHTDLTLIALAEAGRLVHVPFPVALAHIGDQLVPSDTSCRTPDGKLNRP